VLADYVGGILAGLIASLIAYGFVTARRLKRNDEYFACLAGTYDVTEKQRETRREGTVTITGNGPLLDFVWTLANGRVARGTLAMNEQSRVTGSGGYEHEPDGWGYLDVRVASRTPGTARLLVDGRYTRPDHGDEWARARVWEMQPAADASPLPSGRPDIRGRAERGSRAAPWLAATRR
jgi:hypothetical protein